MSDNAEVRVEVTPEQAMLLGEPVESRPHAGQHTTSRGGKSLVNVRLDLSAIDHAAHRVLEKLSRQPRKVLG